MHIQKNNQLGENHTNNISFLPYVHNVDSFGYNTDIFKKGIPYETESWGWLLDEKHHGRVGTINAPTIGLFDLALAAQAKGLMSFGNIGAMTKPELDQLFGILIGLKQSGHFSGMWSSVPESVQFMKSGRVVIENRPTRACWQPWRGPPRHQA